MPATLGSATVVRFINEAEAHKLHLEFVVESGQTVNAGDSVILANNGKVQLAGTTAPAHTIIGVAINSGAAGDKVTVAMKAYCVVVAEAGAASLNAGPVQMGAWNGTTGRREFVVVTGADNAAKTALHVGFNLKQVAADGDQIYVALI